MKTGFAYLSCKCLHKYDNVDSFKSVEISTIQANNSQKDFESKKEKKIVHLFTQYVFTKMLKN